ncbi:MULTISPECIES: alpha-galactosidase [Streptococcus]|uniref:Alpha-galactosidase n=1 Tax=Streptococcus caledonicus TaxID=2614158 RepID=A0ABW0UE73_9STRE|nr:alpha-galactosidase [Streptococcus sp. S784/96/1]
MMTLITFIPETRTFHLSNERLSYLFMIEEGGLLSHLYFGKKVKRYHNHMTYPRIDRGFSGNIPSINERGYSKDTLPQEFSGGHSGDYRTPSLMVKGVTGSYSVDLRYKSHRMEVGKPVLEGLPASFATVDEAETLIITLEDSLLNLEVELFYTIFKNQDIIARSSRLINCGNQNLIVEKVASLQIDFVAKDFDVISLPGAYANERHMERETIGYGIKTYSSKRGTSSHHMNPFLVLADKKTDEFTGDSYGFHLVYSGNHSFEVEKDHISQVRLVAGINDYGFEWHLGAGESFQAPEVLMTYSENGLNGMSQNFHHIIRDNVVRSKHRNKERPILVNNWEATYFDFNEEKLHPIVDEAKKMGIEMFVLDDGWFGHRNDDQSSLGDWQVWEDKFPNGLKHFADYVHKQGLKFGLWFEPEMISKDSNLYRSHPDYLMQIPGREPSPSRSQFVLDMGRKDVQDAIFTQLKLLLDEGYIDYIKWDMNRHLSDIHSLALIPNRQGEAGHRYVLGVYALLEKITSTYPDILFEGCSGGGGRFDLGWAYYMPQSWASDNTDALARLTIQYGTSLAYPISMMTSHVSAVPNHQTGRVTTLEARAHVAMSGVLGYELDLTKMSDSDKVDVIEQIASYKKIRPLVQYGDFYRLKSPKAGNETAWIFVSENQKEALLFTAHVLAHAQPYLSKTLLIGLNPDWDYRLEELPTGQLLGHSVGYFDSIYATQPMKNGSILSGDELMQMGIYNPIVRQDMATQLYYFKAID